MGRKLEIEWHETASELKNRYRKERNAERKTRLHAFWQLRLGKTLKEVAQLVGIGYRTLQNWVAWYRHGGLAEVLRRIKGHGNQGWTGVKLKSPIFPVVHFSAEIGILFEEFHLKSLLRQSNGSAKPA